MALDVHALWLIAFLLALARALGWLMVVQPFANRGAIPVVVTVATAAALALIVAPGLERSRLPTSTGVLVGDLALQVLSGLAIGFVVQLMISAVSAAGTFLDQVGGLTIQPVMNPVGVTEPPLMGNFYRQVVVLLLFATNGYLLMIEGFAHSFAGPGFSLESTRTIGTVVLVDLQVFFVSALEIGGPIMVVLFAAQVVLALVSRAAPQANVWFLGMPLQVLLVLVLVALAVAAVPGDLASLLDRGLGDAARLFGRP